MELLRRIILLSTICGVPLMKIGGRIADAARKMATMKEQRIELLRLQTTILMKCCRKSWKALV